MTQPLTAHLAKAASLLVDARRTGQPLAALPADAMPHDDAEAWAVQEEVVRLLGATIGGWKVGIAAGAAPTRAPLMTADLHHSPTNLPAAMKSGLAVEGEIAFRLGRDLPARPGRPYSREEVLDAVETAFAVIEVVQSRFADRESTPRMAGFADAISNGALITGAPATAWRDLDLSRLKVTLRVDGATAVEQIGGNPNGDPVPPLVWLANHVAERGIGLRAGQVVTTGSCTGVTKVQPGQTATVAFDGFGTAEVRFA